VWPNASMMWDEQNRTEVTLLNVHFPVISYTAVLFLAVTMMNSSSSSRNYHITVRVLAIERADHIDWNLVKLGTQFFRVTADRCKLIGILNLDDRARCCVWHPLNRQTTHTTTYSLYKNAF